MDAQTAANQAVSLAQASALAAEAQAKIAYTLTYDMIDQNQGALSFPLIALAFAAMTQGLLAYVATQSAAGDAASTSMEAWRAAEARCQTEFQKAVQRVDSLSARG